MYKKAFVLGDKRCGYTIRFISYKGALGASVRREIDK